MQGHIQILEQKMPVLEGGHPYTHPASPKTKTPEFTLWLCLGVGVVKYSPLGSVPCAREEPHSCLSPLQRPDSFPLTQSRALQLLYDLRYLSIILTARSEDTKPSRIKQDSGYGTFWGVTSSSNVLGGPKTVL